jgi:MYXO-CTERM domain-containing protein
MTRRITIALAAAMVGLAMAAVPGAAQDGAAGALYFEASDKETALPDPDCVSVPFHGLNPSLDPAAESVRLAVGTSLVGVSCPAVFEYAVDAPVALSGSLIAHFFVECDVASVDGGLGIIGTFAYEVTKNGDPVTDTFFGSAQLGNCADGDVVEIVETGIPSGDTEYAAGDVLGLNLITFAGPSVSDVVDGLYILAGSLDHPSALMGAGLPSGGGAAAGPIVDQLHGDELDLSLGFANHTNESYLFHWESPLDGPVDLLFELNLTSGTVTVDVSDGVNATLLNATFDGSTSRMMSPEAASGNWTVRLDLADAAGDLRMKASAAPPGQSQEPTPSPTGASDDDGDNVSAPDDNDTAGNASVDGSDDQGLPGPSIVMVAAALGLAAAIAVRRRR